MRKSHFNDQFLVLLGPIISRFFACSNEEKNKPKQLRVHALVLSLLSLAFIFNQIRLGSYTYSIIRSSTRIRQMLDMDERLAGTNTLAYFASLSVSKKKVL
jgi:hypothetical protein